MLALYSQSFLDLNHSGGASNVAIGQQANNAAAEGVEGAPATFDWTALLAGGTLATGGHQPLSAARLAADQHEHHDDVFRRYSLGDTGLESAGAQHHYTADQHPSYQVHPQHYHVHAPHHQSKQSAL